MQVEMQYKESLSFEKVDFETRWCLWI